MSRPKACLTTRLASKVLFVRLVETDFLLQNILLTAIDEDDESGSSDEDDEDDDDSEYLSLAPWFDENQSSSFPVQPSNQQPDAQSTTNNNRNNLTAGDISTTSTHILDSTFELDSNQSFSRHVDIMTGIVDLLVGQMRDDAGQDGLIKQAISSDIQVTRLAFYLREIETNPDRLPTRLVNSLMQLMKMVLCEGLLTHTQQVRLI
jgi:hypothetical protein